jgi:hypothetical protein
MPTCIIHGLLWSMEAPPQERHGCFVLAQHVYKIELHIPTLSMLIDYIFTLHQTWAGHYAASPVSRSQKEPCMATSTWEESSSVHVWVSKWRTFILLRVHPRAFHFPELIFREKNYKTLREILKIILRYMYVRTYPDNALFPSSHFRPLSELSKASRG